MKEKVLLLSSRPLENSGMTKIILDIADCNRGIIDFDLACSFIPEGGGDDMLRRRELQYIELPEKRKLWAYMKSINNLVKKGEYETVYVHGNSSLMLLEALPSKLAGATVVTHCHNTKPNRFCGHYYLMKPFFNCLPDIKVACSQKAAQWAYMGRKAFTIRNGIEIDRFAFNNQRRAQVRANMGIQDEFVVGHIGLFNEQKNQKRLIDIFECVLKMKKNSKLLLIGDGELKNESLEIIRKKGLNNHVIQIDYADNPEDYLQAMDVMVIPSLFEGFCLAALEAQAAGLPVVMSEAIPNEAIATDICKRVHLKESNKKWAECVITSADTIRTEKTGIIDREEYSIKNMMKSIQKILLRSNAGSHIGRDEGNEYISYRPQQV